MNQAFRLLATSLPGTGDIPSVSARRVQLAPNATSDLSWTTVMIGRNGVGKSRLLAGVTAAFDALDGGRPLPKGRASITYQIGSDVCEFEMASSEGIARLNGRRVAPSELPLPHRVIAVTTAPFDKFRVPPRPGSRTSRPESAIYRYLGLRDFSGRASATGAVFRALNELFLASATTEDRRTRIASVFTYLAYQPGVDVTYRWTPRGGRFVQAVLSGQPLDAGDWDHRYSSTPTAFERLSSSNPEFLQQAAETVREALARSDGQWLKLRADFENQSEDAELFQRLQLLRRAELIDIASVLLTRLDTGTPVDLRDTSSGELALVTGLLGVASAIEDSSLIVIDEPEISLHPEWQTQYLDLLNRTFASYSGCHFVVATHSPLVVSDISADDANVVSLDPNKRMPEDGGDYSGQSTDYVLLRAFDVASESNLYLKQVLVDALRLAADGDIQSEKFRRGLDLLKEVVPNMEGSTQLRSLVANLDRSLRRAEAESR